MRFLNFGLIGSWFRRAKKKVGIVPVGKIKGMGKPRYVYAFEDFVRLAESKDCPVPTLADVDAHRSGGGVVAPQAPAPSSTLRLELIVEAP